MHTLQISTTCITSLNLDSSLPIIMQPGNRKIPAVLEARLHKLFDDVENALAFVPQAPACELLEESLQLWHRERQRVPAHRPLSAVQYARQPGSREALQEVAVMLEKKIDRFRQSSIRRTDRQVKMAEMTSKALSLKINSKVGGLERRLGAKFLSIYEEIGNIRNRQSSFYRQMKAQLQETEEKQKRRDERKIVEREERMKEEQMREERTRVAQFRLKRAQSCRIGKIVRRKGHS